MNRRIFLLGAGTLVLALPFIKGASAMGLLGKEKKQKFSFHLSDEEWRNRLTEQQYNVLRRHDTERSASSPLNDEKRNGLYRCVGCGWLLFSSESKFESGTGWPSFWQPANEDSVGTSTDYKMIVPRTEVHCANCGGHLGHVFKDGPPPTGLRYCMNGVAMVFNPI
ncbi:MAG: peptide-methionine (R)-S-oxide reductase [Alphaproteobacteria bacterium CG_4_9_14_3_um_filter_47_13]|nr:MAG: peptide-methionine (R)-S-oxide reductase [Alphaproteobacteria bacterium CG_4_9_14_3_um_filter_47_13]